MALIQRQRSLDFDNGDFSFISEDSDVSSSESELSRERWYSTQSSETMHHSFSDLSLSTSEDEVYGAGTPSSEMACDFTPCSARSFSDSVDIDEGEQESKKGTEIGGVSVISPEQDGKCPWFSGCCNTSEYEIIDSCTSSSEDEFEETETPPLEMECDVNPHCEGTSPAEQEWEDEIDGFFVEKQTLTVSSQQHGKHWVLGRKNRLEVGTSKSEIIHIWKIAATHIHTSPVYSFGLRPRGREYRFVEVVGNGRVRVSRRRATSPTPDGVKKERVFTIGSSPSNTSGEIQFVSVSNRDRALVLRDGRVITDHLSMATSWTLSK